MKSQYTDNITGDVIVDLRSVDDKIINFGSVIPIISPKNMYTSTNTKYSNKGIAANSGLYYDESIDLNIFTFSWWQNILSNDNSSSSWDGVVLYNNTIGFHFLVRYNNSRIATNFAQYTPSWRSLADNYTNSPASNNTWCHYAITFDGSSYKFYRNGNLMVTTTYNKVGAFYGVAIVTTNSNPIGHSIFDDVCLIKDQVLWTTTFDPPNYLLTGDKELPKKIKTRQLMYPPRIGDYFDKAYLY